MLWNREPKQGEGIRDFLGLLTAMLLGVIASLIYVFCMFCLICIPIYIIWALWTMFVN